MMTESVRAEPPPAPDPKPNSSEFDPLVIPPMDPLFLSGHDEIPNETVASDLGFPLEDNSEFELTFDGFDDLYFPAENESFLIPSAALNPEQSGNFTQESLGSGVSTAPVLEDVDKYLNCWSSESGSCNHDSPQDSGDQCTGAKKNLNVLSPVSSQGSENCGSGVSEAMNESSPESGNITVEQKVKVEEIGTTNCVTKRKKENEDTSSESPSSKYRRSNDNAVSSAAPDEEDEKRKARLMRNRESAQLSRQRKKHYVEELEEKVRSMHSTIAELNSKISYFMAENATLRQQLGSGAGMCPSPHPPPPPGMYPPMAPMPFPWMPCPPYVVKAQGSQVPLVPIPRLKTQPPSSTSKAKKSDSKKGEVKTKKVASISFLGLLFFILLFGGLAPIVNLKYGGIGGEYRSSYITDQFYSQRYAKVLAVNGGLNGSDGVSGIGLTPCNRVHSEIGCEGGSGRAMLGIDKSVPVANGSEPLVASLFVPRNDKLVKIDGNLIIHSVLASEKAMASRKVSETTKERETGLAIPKDVSPALPVPDISRNGEIAKNLYRTNAAQPKALSSGSADSLKDHFKSSAADGKMQQWFREGVAGPMMSSGMCTEVFQFDVSPTPGAIVPASSAANVTAEGHQNTTTVNRGKNRRFLHGLPVPLPGSDFNITKEHIANSSEKESKKSAKSMVVSVLVDPREGVDGDIDGMVAPPKSLSRIFVVVLLDSVKYVTYSCVLPRSGGPHLVTA